MIHDEARNLMRFKSLVAGALSSPKVNQWCLENGVEIVLEIPEIAPMEIFCLGLRIRQDLDIKLEDKIQAFIERVGDRIPVSENEDFAYLFPKDLYEKILILGAAPA